MKKLIVILCCFTFATKGSFAKESLKKSREKTICLNMIVKNESEVIERCLRSLKGIIDYWVIVDTGSTDGTQEIIKKYLKDIPGKLYERPWVDFGHNRTEALGLAKGKGDYVLFIDADEVLVFSGPFDKSILEKDLYLARLQFNEIDIKRTLLINNRLKGVKWIGALHERFEGVYLENSEVLDEVIIFNKQDGCRSKDPLKYIKDAQVLEEALKKEPENGRYVFYLAQSYLNANEQTLALKNYEKRVSMKTNDVAEIFWSLLMIGEIQERLMFPPETVIDSYCKAYHYLPTQAEPLLRLSSYFTNRQNYIVGYSIAKMGMSIPPSREMVFSMPWIYTYGFQTVIAECCFQMGKYSEAYDTLRGTLNNPLPPDIQEKILANLHIIKMQMNEIQGK